MLGRMTVLLRNQIESNPHVVGPWLVARPGFVVFATNHGSEDSVLHIKGGPARHGPFVREYGSDSQITIKAGAHMQPVVITDIPKFVALHLTEENPDGVRLEMVGYEPLVSQDLATESVTVV